MMIIYTIFMNSLVLAHSQLIIQLLIFLYNEFPFLIKRLNNSSYLLKNITLLPLIFVIISFYERYSFAFLLDILRMVQLSISFLEYFLPLFIQINLPILLYNEEKYEFSRYTFSVRVDNTDTESFLSF